MPSLSAGCTAILLLAVGHFGGMDPYRMVANTAIYADFQPPSQGFRADPYDNQSGEIEVEGRGLRYQEYERTRSLICIKELP